MLKSKERLHSPEQVTVRIVKDELHGAPGFLRLRRLTLQNEYRDGSTSKHYPYDLVERDAIDAVAILLERSIEGVPHVCLRSALRPPLAFRKDYAVPIRESSATPVQWEVPAGLVEQNEVGEAGLKRCAARETEEEVGVAIDDAAFALLGPAVALSPGVLGEKIFFLHATLDEGAHTTPKGDGSVVEEHAELVFVPLREALAAVRDGRIQDVKSEVGIRRLSELRSLG